MIQAVPSQDGQSGSYNYVDRFRLGLQDRHTTPEWYIFLQLPPLGSWPIYNLTHICSPSTSWLNPASCTWTVFVRLWRGVRHWRETEKCWRQPGGKCDINMPEWTNVFLEHKHTTFHQGSWSHSFMIGIRKAWNHLTILCSWKVST